MPELGSIARSLASLSCVSFGVFACAVDSGVPLESERIAVQATGTRTASSIGTVPRDETWTWVNVPGTRCGLSAKNTGMVVNATEAPEGLLVFLNGGGACWDELTCRKLELASSLYGFGVADWDAIVDSADEKGHFGYFDRSAPENPFARYDMVFLPYCTGDLHGGNAIADFNGESMHFVGYKNVTRFLSSIVPSYRSVDHVVLAGGSAGAFGVMWNHARTQRAWGATPVHALIDSGPPLGPSVLTPEFQSRIDAAWSLATTKVKGARSTRHEDVLRFSLKQYPDRRFAVISSVSDEVIRMFMAFGFVGLWPAYVPAPVFADGLSEISHWLQAYPNAANYFIDGAVEPSKDGLIRYAKWHVFFKTKPGNPHIRVSGSSVGLHDWIEAFTTGASNWQSIQPPRL